MKVVKTHKLFIGGAFVRSESGCTQVTPDGIRYSEASRKDLRNAVSAAEKGQALWSKQTAYLKGQMIYRMAEMWEGHPEGLTETQLEAVVSRLVYYAGFSDKFQQILGSTNPVAGPFFHVTAPEPRGVTCLLSGVAFNPAQLVDSLAANLVAGNATIVVLKSSHAHMLAPLSEVVATADIPPGVVNVLVSDSPEVVDTMCQHREVRGLVFLDRQNQADREKWMEGLAANLKRVSENPPQRCLDAIQQCIEYKSVWHPRGT